MSAVPFFHADRPRSRLRPLKAVRHFINLITDTEDTEQAFQIMAALSGRKSLRIASTFWHSPAGQRLLDSRLRLIDILDDHETLRQLPEGSVGRVYVDFMEREKLTAAGLEQEYRRFSRAMPRYDDGMQRYIDRLRDTHDLMHVLTGYGRDVLGEQCLFALTYSQTGNYGRLFIAYAGALELRRRIGFPVPTLGAVREAQRIGKAARYVAEEDIVALLREPLAAARKRMNFAPPTVYHRARAVMKKGNWNPDWPAAPKGYQPLKPKSR